MGSIAPNIVLPECGFEFANGLPQTLLTNTISLLLDRYRGAFSKEIELVEIPACFAFGAIQCPFVGVIWARKKHIRKNILKPTKRNVVIPVSNTQLDLDLIIDEIKTTLQKLGGNIRRFDTSFFQQQPLKFYHNIYERTYYQYMLDKETNPLHLRVMRFRASYNRKYISQWEYGASMLGIKLKGYGFLYSLIADQ